VATNVSPTELIQVLRWIVFVTKDIVIGSVRVEFPKVFGLTPALGFVRVHMSSVSVFSVKHVMVKSLERLARHLASEVVRPASSDGIEPLNDLCRIMPFEGTPFFTQPLLYFAYRFMAWSDEGYPTTFCPTGWVETHIEAEEIKPLAELDMSGFLWR
jgi:hypothetical protein